MLRVPLRILYIALLIPSVLLVLAAACVSERRTNTTSAPSMLPSLKTGAGRDAARAAAPGVAAPVASVAHPAGQSGAVSLDRTIIRTANLTLTADDPRVAAESAITLTERLGGYISSSDLSDSGGKPRASLTLRVPAADFDRAMMQLRRLGVKVNHESISGQDVTEEYSDTQARLRNLQATADQLRALLETVRQKSDRPEDILTVFRELTAVQGQIEQAQGRLQYLEKLSDLATINLDLRASEAAVQRPAWQPAQTLHSAVLSLRAAAQAAVDILIWLAILVLPLALATGALIILPLRRYRRRNAARSAA